jgi:uncharacterized membrane protein YtjA (UPF0391 family)
VLTDNASNFQKKSMVRCIALGKLRAPEYMQLNFHFLVFPSLMKWRIQFMLRWALIFFVVALMAAVLGFTGIALAAAGVAKILFYIFVILFVLSLLGHVARRP